MSADQLSRAPVERPRVSRSGRFGLVLFAAILAVVLLGPFVAPYDPYITQGVPYSPPTSDWLLGLDGIGRDVLSRVLYGGRGVLLFAAVATLLAYLIGVSAGLIAGYRRGWTDSVVMRGMDVLLAFPALVFILVLSNGLSRSIWMIVVATAIIQVPPLARIVRAATLEQVGSGYVDAAVTRGESTPAILFREILPNISRTLAADAGLRFTWSVLLIASVNFLGLGLQPPAADWGLMVSENRAGISLNPWAVLAPALMLGLLTISMNLVGDSMTDER